jgi:hypothetical protein
LDFAIRVLLLVALAESLDSVFDFVPKGFQPIADGVHYGVEYRLEDLIQVSLLPGLEWPTMGVPAPQDSTDKACYRPDYR